MDQLVRTFDLNTIKINKNINNNNELKVNSNKIFNS